MYKYIMITLCFRVFEIIALHRYNITPKLNLIIAT